MTGIRPGIGEVQVKDDLCAGRLEALGKRNRVGLILNRAEVGIGVGGLGIHEQANAEDVFAVVDENLLCGAADAAVVSAIGLKDTAVFERVRRCAADARAVV